MLTHKNSVIVLRWVDNELEAHEDFVGLYVTSSTDSKSLVGIIKDVLIRLNLNIHSCRGQCYDGAAAMRGCQNGLAVQILQEEPRALYTHCYGHSLNLACQDTIRDIKVLRDALDTSFELSKLLKYSAKRNAQYKQIQAELSPEEPGFRTLCPTRWTVRSSSLQSILRNYSVLQASLASFADTAKRDPEMLARCAGIAAQFQTFNFLFGISLGEKVLSLADNLSRALQQNKVHVAEGQAMASLTIKALRIDSEFLSFWEQVMEKMQDIDVSEPSLPRKRKVPSRYELGGSEYHNAENVEDYYRPIYFSVLDTIIQCIVSRFDQPGYKTYENLVAILLKGADGKSFAAELSVVLQLYAEDLDKDCLCFQLQLVHAHFKECSTPPTFMDIVSFVKSVQPVLPEVVKLVTLIFVASATSATSERSFSALQLIKTYLQATMSQARLNHLLLLHVHKEHCDKLSLEQCANDFCFQSEFQSYRGTHAHNVLTHTHTHTHSHMHTHLGSHTRSCLHSLMAPGDSPLPAVGVQAYQLPGSGHVPLQVSSTAQVKASSCRQLAWPRPGYAALPREGQ